MACCADVLYFPGASIHGEKGQWGKKGDRTQQRCHGRGEGPSGAAGRPLGNVDRHAHTHTSTGWGKGPNIQMQSGSLFV